MIENLQQRIATLEGELALMKDRGTVTIEKDKVTITNANIVDALKIGEHKMIVKKDENTIVLYN